MAYQLIIERRGKCKACGWCCGFRNGKKIEGACTHLTNAGKCAIHDKKDQFCEEHKKNHVGCIEEPLEPFRKIHPNCGYGFYIKRPYLLNVEVIWLETRTGSD